MHPKNAAVVSARVTSEDAPQQAGAPPEPAPKAGILSWVLGGGGGGGAAAGAAAAGAQGADGLALLAEELGPSEEEVAFELEASKGEPANGPRRASQQPGRRDPASRAAAARTRACARPGRAPTPEARGRARARPFVCPGEALPPSDPEIMDWMEDALEGRG